MTSVSGAMLSYILNLETLYFYSSLTVGAIASLLAAKIWSRALARIPFQGINQSQIHTLIDAELKKHLCALQPAKPKLAMPNLIKFIESKKDFSESLASRFTGPSIFIGGISLFGCIYTFLDGMQNKAFSPTWNNELLRSFLVGISLYFTICMLSILLMVVLTKYTKGEK